MKKVVKLIMMANENSGYDIQALVVLNLLNKIQLKYT